MTVVFFETHSTSIDNEAGIASGHRDVPLSSTGRRQAEELGRRYEGIHLEAICCSDLERSYETAAIAFRHRTIPIVRDARLKECDYGELTGATADHISRYGCNMSSTRFQEADRSKTSSHERKTFWTTKDGGRS